MLCDWWFFNGAWTKTPGFKFNQTPQQLFFKTDPKHKNVPKPSLWQCKEATFLKFEHSGYFFLLLLYLEGRRKKKKSICHTLRYRIHGRMGIWATAWEVPDPEQRTKSCLQAAGPLSSATPLPEVSGLQDRLASLQTWNPLPQEQSKAGGAKFLPEGAQKKATTWMNETVLRAPGAGFSLKSEKEKSKDFF